MKRRSMLKRTAAAAAASFAPLKGMAKQKGFTDNYIIRENQKVGTTDWINTNVNYDVQSGEFLHVGSLRSSTIEGYANKLYVRACDDINFHVSASPSSDYTIKIYRLGYYGGTGGRLMHETGTLQATTQPTPTMGARRLIECNWPVSHSLTIPEDWLSGFYLAQLETSDGWQNYMSFVVCDDRECDIIFQVADLSSRCYDRWPIHHSLYCTDSSDSSWSSSQQCSFLRPQGKMPQQADDILTLGAGDFMNLQWPIAYWMEEQGYDVSYVSSMYTHHNGSSGITRAKGYVSCGHDEYWTQNMWDNVSAARDQGVSLAFFAGNTVFGNITFENNETRFSRAGGFGNGLVGGGGAHICGGDWRIMEPNHWLFNDTGAVMGSSIKGILGWEVHSSIAGIPGIEVVAHGPTLQFVDPTTNEIDGSNSGYFNSTYYDVAGGNNFVFNAATIWWCLGFNDPPGYTRSNWFAVRQTPDQLCMDITKNVLDEMIVRG